MCNQEMCCLVGIVLFVDTVQDGTGVCTLGWEGTSMRTIVVVVRVEFCLPVLACLGEGVDVVFSR